MQCSGWRFHALRCANNQSRTSVAARDSGIPVIIVATELDEATQLGDRIAVMYRGKVVGIVPADTSRTVLGQMMAGVA